MFLSSLLLILCTTWSGAFGAQAKDDLDIKLTARRVAQGQDGKETFEPADKAKPGDIIEYTGVFFNKTKGPLANLKPQIPIPVGMEYVADSAKPKPSDGSLNGRTFSPLPLKRTVTLAGGQQKEEEVPLSAYRAIRWNAGELGADTSVTMSLRARVISLNATPAR